MRKEELVEYWKRSSDENYSSMMNMFASKEYTWSLFVGHLCIEKLLKALYVKHVDINTPRTHNLYKLACTLGIDITENQADILQYINLFNIETRYEDYRREFYQKCTRQYTEQQIANIKDVRQWLLRMLNP
ncbi:HEPN domain-containing protein [Desulfonatronovibrio magnus]|uniref:HEPN domain-containing protein n=1 Tax=Desulfonatronovibrio magnus TaxID=698827 RepID=UPI0005EB807A|nr:HEPN domain-containing protein [Desulfonatronovibrio magnus]